jgi:hypothetical protein
MAIQKEVQLYGEAEAIRVLYQTVAPEQSPPKPPRPRRGHRQWVARFLDRFVDRLSPSLPDPVGSKA